MSAVALETAVAWEPGDPLHQHPGLTLNGCARRLFDVIEDNTVATLIYAKARCIPCLVTWGDPAVPCFVCGGPSS